MSWTRERLKTNGRIAFKKNYWSCVAVAVIMGIITGLSGVNGGRIKGGMNAKKKHNRTVCMEQMDLDICLPDWRLQWQQL